MKPLTHRGIVWVEELLFARISRRDSEFDASRRREAPERGPIRSPPVRLDRCEKRSDPSGGAVVATGSGSSSTAGEPTAPDWQVKIVPYPARVELALRRNFFGAMIDVLNRGLGGQEAPEELSRFESDVIAEAPALVIWQVGSNAVFRSCVYNPADVEAAIKTGLRWLAGLPMDVVLMDMQYTTALTLPARIARATQIEEIILEAADVAKVNVFRRWDLMKKWVDDGVATLADLTDPEDQGPASYERMGDRLRLASADRGNREGTAAIPRQFAKIVRFFVSRWQNRPARVRPDLVRGLVHGEIFARSRLAADPAEGTAPRSRRRPAESQRADQ